MTLFRKILPSIYTCLFLSFLSGQPAAVRAETFKVVIDAGHGGHDTGAPGKKTNEKTINLAVAKALAAELKDDDEVKIIMTRDKDVFVTLIGRANIANKADGDLFVSIHTNSLDRKNPKAQTISGASVYTLGLSRSDDNLAVAMRENSVMTLEPDYTTTYQGFDPKSAESYIIFEMDQNLHLDQSISAAKYIQGELVRSAGRRDRGVRQGPFSVLRNTSMPAVLIELDFICNPEQEKYMASEAGCRKLANAIAEGIKAYKEDIIRARMKANGTTPERRRKNAKARDNQPKKDDGSQPAIVVTQEEVYKIQFMTSPKKVGEKAYGGLENVDFYSHNGTLKYTTGSYKTRKAAEADLPRVKKKFKDAFIVKMRGTERVE